MKISFANQVGLLAESMGADPHTVLDAIGTDQRIGSKALLAGLPFGGPCFPRDNRAFLYAARLRDVRAPLAEATDIMNHRLLRVILERVPPHGDVGILGLAYKPGTSITEDSAGTWWRQALGSRGRRVLAHDVQASHTHSIEEVLRCPTVIVACAWPEYRKLHIRANTTLIDPMRVLPGPASQYMPLPTEVEA